ncbi:Cycloisomaltooligosaccharide glucanotransferase precursor [Sedimentisphaera cyanobacteriorum]|uniref:Cycloisomaltooligosaccharide glucanotransferase n=1 Tax=Sedimentisphaera cyanobacteriorum TaxID=1940790 RepID=A0A1Q2HN22_9BACT|nr:glycoside hydrolase family 66 protein [Sedimentisphaera cyanobacteriorum]AQQ08838.1 Cycloisomaltooligosaccharide glucanotransferase precursor [Sedimentisphaera cyanobacteriorum]
MKHLIKIFLAGLICTMSFAGLRTDFNLDGKVDLSDFAAVANKQQDRYKSLDISDLAFQWLSGLNQSDAFIEKVYTDGSRYSPNANCCITVKCANPSENAFSGTLRLRVLKNTGAVYSASDSISISSFGNTNKTFSFQLPPDDFQGYQIEALLNNADSETSAIDVSSDWKMYPRYGYVTEFYEGQKASRNIEIMNSLSRDYHINSLQYYDWMWRHENVIQRNQDGSIKDPWQDWRGAEISYSVLAHSISEAHDRNMAAMPYFQAYCGLDDYQQISGVSPEWGLYSDQSHQNQYYHDAGTKIWVFNPFNLDWQNHLCGEFTDAMQALQWDGLHIDQLGNIGSGSYFDYWGEEVNLADGLRSIVNRSKMHLDWLETEYPYMQGRDAVIFNIVDGGAGSWASSEIVEQSSTDVIYSELWANDTYRGVRDFIRYAKQESGGKAVVLPAYMNKGEDTGGYFDEDSVLLADAAFFACGAFHLELGDGDFMLANEFFPSREKLMTDSLKDKLKDYYSFITANEKLLFSPELRLGDSGLQWIDIPEISLSGDASSNTVWFLNRANEDFEIFHLVNLLGNDSLWRNQAASPNTVNDFTVKLRLGPNAEAKKVFCGSPDRNGGSFYPLSFTEGRDSTGDFISFTVKELKYWDMILVERDFNTPQGYRYEAEDAIKFNTAVDNDHPGFSGEGFVDQFTGVYDSVSFYVKAVHSGSYNIKLNYASANESSRRTVIINGDSAGKIDLPILPNWDSWAVSSVSAELEKGINQVCIYYAPDDFGDINIDYIETESN